MTLEENLIAELYTLQAELLALKSEKDRFNEDFNKSLDIIKEIQDKWISADPLVIRN